MREDGFATYDNKVMTGANHTNMDWPVTVFFYGNANIEYIKSVYSVGGGYGQGIAGGHVRRETEGTLEI